MGTTKTLGYQLLFPLARAMLAATFVISAVRHLTHWSAALDEMVGDAMPRSSLLLSGSVALRRAGGLSVLLGFRARSGAALLLVFVVPAAFLAHDFWMMPPARQTHETVEFLNNMAIASGALLVALHGAGPWSIDVIQKHRTLFHRNPTSTAI